jgi:glutaconyl-CoA/methylmalonyl-CoA decarboxylase subunit gamma
MKKYIIKLNGKVYEVEMEEVTGEVAATVTEQEKPAQVQSVPQSALQAAPPASGGEVIEAPMPGSIVAVSVKVGDIIKKGQVLVVLEAMKMENEIVSPVDGKITAVSVSKGDTVNAGAALVQIA